MEEIKVIEKKCTGCGDCVQACPCGAISIIEGLARISEDCQLCRACISACPTGAIEIVEERRERLDLSQYKGILVFGEQREGRIALVVYELIGKGREIADELGEELSCVVLGSDVRNQAEDLISYGVDKVYVYDDLCLAIFRDDPYADLLTDLVSRVKPNIFLIGATSIGRSLAPRVASRLKTGLTADCTGLEIDQQSRLLLQTRPAFGGNVMATIICLNSRPQMATVRYKIMKRAERIPGYKGEVIQVEFSPDILTDRTKVKGFIKEEVGMSITEAEIIVSGGKGLGSPEGFKLIRELADLLGGAVGASRTVVDEGWISYPHQVGLSGKTVRPRLYIACGISGSVQHLAGMSGSEIIVAINRDPSAPIFKVADLGLVGDLYEVVPRLIERIKELKGIKH
ncbi:MAG: FAD-binding protein [Candidatus Bathyarchaeia archaeon]